MKICEILLYVSRVRFLCAVIRNFQIGKIYAEAKIPQFAPWEINLLDSIGSIYIYIYVCRAF